MNVRQAEQAGHIRDACVYFVLYVSGSRGLSAADTARKLAWVPAEKLVDLGRRIDLLSSVGASRQRMPKGDRTAADREGHRLADQLVADLERIARAKGRTGVPNDTGRKA